MALNTVTVTWDLTDFLQVAVPDSCTITFTPTSLLADAADNVIILNQPRSVTFTGGTGSRAGIVANDNAALVPTGTAYSITVFDNSTGLTVVPQFTAIINFSAGATQDLADLYAAQVSSSAAFFQYITVPQFNSLIANYTAPTLGTCRSVQLYGADPTGAVVADTAFASALTATIGSANPLTTTRSANGYIYIPAGTYKLTQDWLIQSVLGLTVKGDSKTSTIILAHGTGFTNAVINADGAEFCRFSDFTILGDGTEGAGSTSTPIPWAMQLTKNTTTHGVSTQNVFERIWVQPFNWQGGIWSGAPAGTTNQVDASTYYDVLVQGGGSSSFSFTTKWLYGFETGNGTFGNQYNHVFHNSNMSGVQTGMWCNASGFVWFGGEPAANAIDYQLNPGAQVNISGIQSQGSGRFIEQTAGGSGSFPISVRDCEFNSATANADGKWIHFTAMSRALEFSNIRAIVSNVTPIMAFSGGGNPEVITLVNVAQNNTFAAGVTITNGGPVAVMNYMQINTSAQVLSTYSQVPGTPPDADLQPSDIGIVAWTGNPTHYSTALMPTSLAGTLVTWLIRSGPGGVASNIIYNLTVAGVGLSNCFLGIYDSTGTRIAQCTTDQSTNLAGTGGKTAALSASVTLAPNTLYYVGLVIGAMSTGPTWTAVGAVGASAAPFLGVSLPAKYQVANTGSGFTALPTSFTPSSRAAISGGIVPVFVIN